MELHCEEFLYWGVYVEKEVYKGRNIKVIFVLFEDDTAIVGCKVR